MFEAGKGAAAYRPEIDGLRSLAVLPVIFYHAALGPFSGGYVGVDIFFVISGYLITSIILADVGKDRFTYAEFYERRVRRIFPALFLVSAATAAGAYWILPPEALRDFGQSVVATILFAANLLFYFKSGYFAPDVDFYPMIHMWSLAVEEQFYLAFPAVLLLLLRWGRSRLQLALCAAIVASFALSIYLQSHDPSANFFLPFSRAWELGLGALIALNDRPWRGYFAGRPALANFTGLAGLALIASSTVLLGRDTPFPGWAALPPVLGTAMIVVAAGTGDWTGRLLSLKPLVWIGLLSYSAYLWHQPMLALARAANGIALGTPAVVAVIGATFVFSFLSWRFVEKPFRNRRFLRRRTIFALAAALSLLLIAFGVAAHLTRGFPDRFTADRVTVGATMELSPMRPCHTDGRDYRRPAEACTYVGARIDWAVLGDSHGVEIGYALAERLRAENRGLLHLTFSACPPAFGFDPSNPGCAAWLEEAVTRIEGDLGIRNVLIAYRNGLHLYGDQREHFPEAAHLPPGFLREAEPDDARGAYWRGFETLVDRLRHAGKQVFVLGPVPELPATAEYYVYRAPVGTALPRSFFEARQGEILARLRIMERAGRIRLIEPDRTLCNSQSCVPILEGQAMYVDDNHLSMAGARRVLAQHWPSGSVP